MGRSTLPTVAYVQQAFVFAGSLGRVRPRSVAARLQVIRRMTRRHLRRADRVLVPTTWLQSWAVEHGFDCDVCMLGAPVKQVAGDRSGPAVWFGSGLSYKRARLAKAVRRGSSAEVTLIDGWSPARAQEALQRARALLVTSEVESLGLPVVEALAQGIPIVAFDARWVRSLAGTAAELVPSTKEAARMLALIEADPAFAEALHRASLARYDTLMSAQPYELLASILAEVAN